jgi:hypothetical protein
MAHEVNAAITETTMPCMETAEIAEKREPSRSAHVVLEPAIVYFRTPVVLVSSLNEVGTPNLAPRLSAWWLGERCPVGFAARSKTAQNIQRTGECVLRSVRCGSGGNGGLTGIDDRFRSGEAGWRRYTHLRCAATPTYPGEVVRSERRTTGSASQRKSLNRWDEKYKPIGNWRSQCRATPYS